MQINKKELRTLTVGVRVTKKEQDEIRKEAYRRGETPSMYMRKLALLAARKNTR